LRNAWITGAGRIRGVKRYWPIIGRSKGFVHRHPGKNSRSGTAAGESASVDQSGA
jgi:hypothetical protein